MLYIGFWDIFTPAQTLSCTPGLQADIQNVMTSRTGSHALSGWMGFETKVHTYVYFL